MIYRLIAVTIIATCFLSNGADTNFVPYTLEGQTFIHDPSTIVKENGRYYIFATGPGVRMKSSPDKIHWTNQFSVFDEMPDWTFSAVPGYQGYGAWAPDIIRVKDKFYLYYAVSLFGKPVSAIGLATNPTLDQQSPNYHWTDCGPVITSNTNSHYNVIDPSVFLDDDGKLWLAFGSFWKGIYLTQLDPQTGKRIDTNSQLYRLAWNKSIEAACLTRHGKYYYLFVNWGDCCKGTNSTYQVRVGSAEKVTGPYLDADGKDLADGGGTPFLSTSGRYIGPGHIGILNESNTTWFSYHYYDTETLGRSRLALGKIDWSSGWPVAINDEWKLVWHDEFDTNGAPNSANWNFERGFVRNEELQWYQPQNAYCTNGLLVIEARHEQKPDPRYAADRADWKASRKDIEYTSASLTTRRLHQFKYGKIEMRARIDTRAGSWPAFWTLGTGIYWPACGEVDIMEYYTSNVLANVAYSRDDKAQWSSPRKPLAELGDEWSKQFHVWSMEWDEDNIDLRLDGRLMNHFRVADADDADGGNPFRRPEYIILNQAIGGTRGGDPSHTQFPIRYEIDWVRVYQRNN